MDLASLDLGEFGKQLFLRLLEQTSTDGKSIKFHILSRSILLLMCCIG